MMEINYFSTKYAEQGFRFLFRRDRPGSKDIVYSRDCREDGKVVDEESDKITLIIMNLKSERPAAGIAACFSLQLPSKKSLPNETTAEYFVTEQKCKSLDMDFFRSFRDSEERKTNHFALIDSEIPYGSFPLL